MQYTKLDKKYQNQLSEHIQKSSPLVDQIVKKLAESGYTALLVGGAVRDLFLGLPIKDLDIEVYHCSMQELENILKQFGAVSVVGKQFGVLRLHGLEVDWSLPRSDSSGRKPEVKVDPHLSYKEAFARRDLTMNAMGINLTTFDLIDPFDGRADIEKKLLRAPDPKFFKEDPLRFYRVMQFVGRFGMMPDKMLNQLCGQMDISTVSRERIEAEFNKLFLKSAKPSLGIKWLDSIGRLREVLPQLHACKGVMQDPRWHPEGDVFEHTLQSIDAAAALEYENDEQKLIIIYAALCHDLGKVFATQFQDDKITNHGHAQESERFARTLLKRITNTQHLIDAVCKLVHYHMEPLQFIQSKASPAAYKRLALKLTPEVTIKMLALLALADRRGRNPVNESPLTKNFEDLDLFIDKAQKAGVFEGIEKPVLQGKDLLDVIPPGPDLGKAVKLSYRIQIEEGIKDKEILKRRILELRLKQ